VPAMPFSPTLEGEFMIVSQDIVNALAHLSEY